MSETIERRDANQKRYQPDQAEVEHLEPIASQDWDVM